MTTAPAYNVDLAAYLPAQAQTLQRRLRSQAWQEILAGPLVEDVCQSRLLPPVVTPPD